jgi:succinate dehydrogenase hydrophobic anchor subunit
VQRFFGFLVLLLTSWAFFFICIYAAGEYPAWDMTRRFFRQSFHDVFHRLYCAPVLVHYQGNTTNIVLLSLIC